MKRLGMLLLCVLGLSLAYAFLPGLLASQTRATGVEVHRIAHAGGGINGQTYTNSYQAMDASVVAGFRYLEIDFSLTSDGELVCVYDWNRYLSALRGVQQAKYENPPNYAEFLESREFATLRNCALPELDAWLQANPAVKLVTDVKGSGNIAALEKVYASISNAAERVIPQIYFPEEFKPVKAMGYENIIWTLYRYPSHSKLVLLNLLRFEGKLAITMPPKRAKSDLPRQLLKAGIPSYVHTINDPQAWARYRDQYGLSEIYTDFLAPQP